DVDREHAETGAQDGTEDFVHFKGVHRLEARAEGQGNWKRPRQIAAVHKYAGCLGSGKPYKRPTPPTFFPRAAAGRGAPMAHVLSVIRAPMGATQPSGHA